MASRWFAVMDSVGKTAGKGGSRWYVKDVAEKLKPVVELKVEREIGAGMEKLAQFTAAHAAWIKHADITWPRQRPHRSGRSQYTRACLASHVRHHLRKPQVHG